MTRWKSTDLTAKRPAVNAPAARTLAPEKANRITKNVLQRICNQPRGWAYRNNTTGIWDAEKQVYRKNAGQNGIPDVVGVVRGFFLAVEVKAGKDRQTDVQRICQQDIECARGVYFLVRSTDEFLKLFDEWLKTLPQ
jgi:hypothetical protein